MLRPEHIAAFGDISREMLHPLNEFLIEDICKRVAKAGSITSTAEYQLYRAKVLGVSDYTIKQALQKQGVLTDTAIEELFNSLAGMTRAFDETGSFRQLVDGYIKVAKKQAKKMTNSFGIITPTGEVVPLKEAYTKTMDFAFQQVFTGATDYTTALRRATNNLASGGIRYVNKGGEKSRTVSIEYATRQSMMSQMGELNEEISQMNHDELGCNGWEISAHSGSAPDHEPYQGKQFSDAAYKELNESKLKRPIGSFSCGHYAMPIILGVNSPQYTEHQLEQMKHDNSKGLSYEGKHYTLYSASQERNGLESSIRETKNHILVNSTIGDAKKLQENQIRLVRLQEEYKKFCTATNQPTQNERLQVVGFGRSESATARAAYKRMLGNNSK